MVASRLAPPPYGRRARRLQKTGTMPLSSTFHTFSRFSQTFRRFQRFLEDVEKHRIREDTDCSHLLMLSKLEEVQ